MIGYGLKNADEGYDPKSWIVTGTIEDGSS